jgi:hypothetical protein
MFPELAELLEAMMVVLRALADGNAERAKLATVRMNAAEDKLASMMPPH